MSEDATLDKFVDTEEKKNEDKNRITGFGTFPSEWDKKNIVQCAKIRDSERIPLNSQEREEKKPGEIPYYGANGVLDYINEYIFDSELILLAEDGGHFEEYQERPIAYRISDKAWVNNHAHILEAKEGTVTDYLFYSLEHRNLVPYVSGSTRSKLTQSMLKKVKIPLPTLEEQRKIATVLHNVDQAIQKTREIREKRQKIRSGLRDSLISKHPDKDTRLVQTGPLSLEIPKNWEIRNLNDFIEEFVNGATISPDDFSSDGIDVIPKKGITSNGVLQVDPEKRQYCSVEFAESNSTNMINSDYLLTTLKDLNQEGPSIGRIVDIEPESGYPKGDEYLLAQGVFGLKTNDGINDEYLIELSNSTWYRKYMKSILVGSTQVHIRNPIFLGIKIPVPPVEEQEEISNTLRKLSNVNELEGNYQTRLERLKRGLMQDLLSGTVRTTNTNVEIPDEIAQHG